jgi:holo-[acyl-carrier protein] synthase
MRISKRVAVIMIYSTGIDLVEISRIEQTFRRHGDRFLRRMFTDNETALIRSRKSTMIATMAGKFAAKEAVMKSLGAFFTGGVVLRDIEILNRPSGMPYVKLPERLMKKMSGKEIHLSVSHEKKYATAVAIISDEG